MISIASLESLETYAGTLIHELIHAKTGLPDVNRSFEIHLTDQIGVMCAKAIKLSYGYAKALAAQRNGSA